MQINLNKSLRENSIGAVGACCQEITEILKSADG
jgi:hypothetical protein